MSVNIKSKRLSGRASTLKSKSEIKPLTRREYYVVMALGLERLINQTTSPSKRRNYYLLQDYYLRKRNGLL